MKRIILFTLLCLPGSACFPAGGMAQELAPSATLSSPSTFSGITCGDVLAMPKRKGETPLSIKDEVRTSCDTSFLRARAYTDARQYGLAYDTLRAFVQRCPTHMLAPNAFGMMSTDVQQGGNGSSPQCWIEFKQWLLSALGWNPHDPTYFCADVETLAGALTSELDTSYSQVNTATNKGLSVEWWLIHNPLCATADDSEGYTNGRGSQRETWFNTQDTTKVPLDTTIYSMHDLGLDSVLKYAAQLGVHEASAETIIMNATAYPNPTDKGTVISFGMKREAYVKIEVYDLLGHLAASNGFESVLEPGTYSIPVSMATLPAGTYYARIISTYGEAQTVKVMKE